MNIYPHHVFFDKLVSPINGYDCKRINNQNIKNFGFNSIEELQTLYPNFPLRCEKNQIHQSENNRIMHLGYKNYSKKIKTNVKTEYDRNPKKCLHCNTTIPFSKKENKFCNYSCSASYTNKFRTHISDETREKISNALSGRQRICQISFCKICGMTIPNKRTKTCSKDCKGKLLSSIVRNAFEEGRHKGNLYRSRNNPSYMESSFNHWLIDTRCEYHWETESPFKRYDINGNYEKCYFADFFFPELKLIIELDGTHHENQIEYDKERDAYIIENYDSVNQIVRITHSEYVSLSRIDEIKSLLNIS